MNEMEISIFNEVVIEKTEKGKKKNKVKLNILFW